MSLEDTCFSPLQRGQVAACSFEDSFEDSKLVSSLIFLFPDFFLQQIRSLKAMGS